MAQPCTITGYTDADGVRRELLSCGHLGEIATPSTFVGAQRECPECARERAARQRPSSLTLVDSPARPASDDHGGVRHVEVADQEFDELTVMALLAKTVDLLGSDAAAKKRVSRWLAARCDDEAEGS